MKNPQYIYVVLSKPQNAIKIGYSTHPYRRLTNLQTGSPVELQLILFFPGGKRNESQLHYLLKKYHIRGEWFKAKLDAAEIIMEYARHSKKYTDKQIVYFLKLFTENQKTIIVDKKAILEKIKTEVKDLKHIDPFKLQKSYRGIGAYHIVKLLKDDFYFNRSTKILHRKKKKKEVDNITSAII